MLSRTLALVAVAVCVALGAACRSATQIEVHLSTDVPCATVVEQHVAMFSGDPATEAAYTSTGDCTAASPMNDIGTIVLTPSDGPDIALDVSFVVGVNARSEKCVTQGYKGCIRARRRVRFVPHEGLRMPVELSLACLDKVCEPEETCFRGACVSPDVISLDGCLGPECSAPPAADAGAPDATVSDAGPSDAATNTDATSTDAAPTVVEVVHETTDMPRGLALEGDVIFWSQAAGAGKSGILFYDLNTGVSGARVPSLDGNVHGIAVSGPVTAYADLSSAVTVIESDGGKPTYPGSASSYFGAGILGPNAYVFTSAKDLLKVPGGTFGPTLGRYLEVANGAVAFASLGSVEVWNPVSEVRVATFPIGDATAVMRGLAAAPNHWLVSTETINDIYAVHNTNGHVAVLSTTDFEQIQDLAWDDARQVLYVAGATKGGVGIYRMRNLPPRFPQ